MSVAVGTGSEGADPAAMPPAVRRYVLALATVAAAVAAVAVVAGGGPGRAEWGTLPFLVLLVGAGEAVHRRVDVRGQGLSVHLLEAALAPLLYAFSGLTVVAVTAAAQIGVSVALRRPLVKSVFNIAQWTLAAAVGSLVVARVSDPLAGEQLLAVLAGLVAVVVVNQVALGVLFALLGADGPARDATAGIGGRLASATVAISLGMLLVGAYEASPWLLAVAAVPMWVLHIGSRGMQEASIDQVRLAGMQRATHALTVSLDPREAVPPFLAALRDSFDARSAQVILVDGSGAREVFTVDAHATERTTYGAGGSVPFADLLSLLAPTRFDLRNAPAPVAERLRATGHRDCLVAPLRRAGRPAGMLAVFDRGAPVRGDLAILGTLAGELAAVLEKSDLVESLLEERQTLGEIVGRTSDGILTLAADGTVESWNAGMAAITGYPAEVMVGGPSLHRLNLRDAGDQPVDLDGWAAAGGALPADLQVRTAEGGQHWLSCSYSPVPASEGRGPRLVVIARNVTQARELAGLQDDFVAVVSHELRTPLSSIKGWAATLLARRDRMTPEQQDEGVRSISRQAHRLEQLVLNILEASKIERGRPGDEPATVDVAHVARKVADDVRALYPHREVRLLDATEPVLAVGTPVWVERALANLAFNAVKYSPDETPVEIRLAWSGTEVAVAVIDHGPGVPPEARERIFQRFERLADARTQTGTGLGLYISRQLARSMGGTVDVESTPGAGSVFTLRLRGASLPVPQQPRDREPAHDR